MKATRIFDVCSGAGGAGMGYHRAGMKVTGVDIFPQPNYPFEFIQGDAFEMLEKYGRDFDIIHASPPCQFNSALTKGTNQNNGVDYPDLIPLLRQTLNKIGRPYIIENVAGAPMRKDLTLCGEMFKLGVIRHRFFETRGVVIQQPTHKRHRGRVAGMRHNVWYEGPYFAVYGEGGGKGTVAEWQQAMGIHWTDVRVEIAEAIPPAYTQYIGEHALQYLEKRG